MMDKEIKELTEEKFVFVDEGASEGLYEPDAEQVVSISDDVFYQELAQDVLQNNVQSKVAKEMAAVVLSETPDETELFVEEAVGLTEEALPVVSVNDAAAGDDGHDGDDEDHGDDDGEWNAEDDAAFTFCGATYVSSFLNEDDHEEDVTDEEEDLDEEDLDEEENLDEDVADEEDEDDEEYLPVFETHFADNTAYSLRDTMEEVFEEPENVYAVEEAEPATEGKVDIMDYLTDEAKSEIDQNCADTATSVAPEAEPVADTAQTQVFEPVSVESGYVDIDDDAEKVRSASPSSHSGSHHHHHHRHRRHISKRRIAKGVIQIGGLLLVVGGVTWLVGQAAFGAYGGKRAGNDTSSQLLYGYSSHPVSSEDGYGVSSVEDEFDVDSLTLGDKNELVLKVQRELYSLSYLKRSDVHGTFDSATKEAVAAFQEMSGMEATGIVDRNTYYALFDIDAWLPTTVTTELPTDVTSASDPDDDDEEVFSLPDEDAEDADATTASTTGPATTYKTTTTTEPTTAATRKTTTTTESTTKKTTTTTTKKTTTTTEKTTTKKTTTTTEKTTTTTEKPTTKKTTTTTEKPTTKKTTTTTEKPTTTKKTSTTTEPTTTTTKKTTTTTEPTTTTGKPTEPTASSEKPTEPTASATEPTATEKPTTSSEKPTTTSAAESGNNE